MTRKEAIEVLTKTAEELKFLITDHLLSRSTKVQYIDLIDAVERLSEPLTLVDLLGWEEGVDYQCRNEKYKVREGVLLNYSSHDGFWYDATEEINDYSRLQQATKVEKQIAYHVKDEYSFNELMKELEEQGYDTGYFKHYYLGLEVIYIEKNETVTVSDLRYYKKYKKDKYDLIEYKKEEPKYYAKIKGWELLRSKEYKGSDCGGKWFIYAPSVGEITTTPEYAGINDAWIASMTKTEWNKLGINDTNADFERAV